MFAHEEQLGGGLGVWMGFGFLGGAVYRRWAVVAEFLWKVLWEGVEVQGGGRYIDVIWKACWWYV